MRLSREKIVHLSKLVLKELETNDAVEFHKDLNEIRLEIVKIITDELKIDDVVDQDVRKVLNSYSRKLEEGSREWDIMYQKLYEQEMNKRRRF